MKRLFKALKLKKAKEDILEQSKQIRIQLEREHGETFKDFQQHAIRAHTGQDQAPAAPSTASPAQDEKLDPKKNLETVMKLMTSKQDSSPDFQRKILKMVKDKQTGKL